MGDLPRYPVYVISKGRPGIEGLTTRFLTRDGVPHKVVVEPQERDAYAATLGEDRLLVLPFSNLGLGSIPARNWVWEHARASGAERHWIFDDNIRCVYRRYRAVRVHCEAGPAIRAVEDLVDRYENVAIAGMNYAMFAPDRDRLRAVVRNVHVYSNLLIRNDLPQRWRGRYNEDTDLCLQVLAAGWCTLQVNAFLVQKQRTMTMKGGNAAELYQGDGRLKMARALERAWPGVVTVERRYGRPQHVVKFAWSRFDTPLRRREGAGEEGPDDPEYGLRLEAVGEVRSPVVRAFLDESGAG